MKQPLFPAKVRILSGSMLKLIAVLTMIIDHIASHLVNRQFVLISFGGFDITLYGLMRGIGRWAFPLFVFLMIEGFLHTRSRLRYGISLGLFALISEIPWSLVHSGTWFFGGQNVFFTLFFGYLGLCVLENIKKLPVLKCALLIALAMLTSVLWTDFAPHGFAFIILLYLVREHEIARPMTGFLLNNKWWVMPSFLIMSLYNGKRGFIKGGVLKYAFYAIYPLHLLVIYFIKYQPFV